jgi:hypothetical protein
MTYYDDLYKINIDEAGMRDLIVLESLFDCNSISEIV